MIRNKAMSRFMRDTPIEVQAEVAKAAGTSRGAMKHLAAGTRKSSSLKAIRLERAAARFASIPLNREELAPACAQCEFAKLCRSKMK